MWLFRNYSDIPMIVPWADAAKPVVATPGGTMKEPAKKKASSPVAHSEDSRNGLGASQAPRKRAQAELSNSLALLRAITEGTTDAVFAKDRQGRYIMANPATAQFIGKSSDEIIGFDDTALFSPETAERIMKRDRSVMDSGETRTDEDAGTTADGVFRAYLTTKGPLRDSSGAINGVFGIARDITERKRAEETLRQAEDRIRLVIDTIPTMAWTLAPDGMVDFVNQRWIDYTGLSLKQEVKEPARPIHPEDLPRVMAKWRVDSTAGELCEDEMRLRGADGKYRWFLVRTAPLHDEQGNIIKWYGVSTDIEDRKQAEMQAARLAAIVESSTDAIIGMDLNGIITSWNGGAESIFTYTAGEMLGGPIRRLIPPDRREEEGQVFDRIKRGENVDHFETAGIEKGGRQVDLSLAVSPIRNADDVIVGASLVARDITGLKRTQDALHTSEERVRELAENIHEVFWMSDPQNTRMIYISPAYEVIWGRSRDTLYASPTSWMEAIHPEDKERMVRARAHRAQATPHDNTYRIVRPDGSIRWIRDRGFPVCDERGEVVRFVGIAGDITEHKLAEEELKREKEILAKIFNNIPVMIGFVGADGGVKLVNPQWERTMGWTLKELRDQNVDIFAEAYPDLSYRQEVLNFVAAATGEWADLRIKVRDGHVVDAACAIVHLSDGTKIAIAQDITERKLAEERLREYEKVVEGLEEMIVVVDRDFRYLLANRAFLNFRGLEREQLIGRLVPDVLGPDAFAQVAEKLNECLAGKAIQYEMRYGFPDNSERDLLVSYLPIEGPGGIDRVACVLQDITERKQAEDRLRRSEEKFKTLFAIAPVGIAFLDSRLNIVECNPALERMSRLSREDLLGQGWRRRTFLNADGSPRLPGERISERAVEEKLPVNGVETGAVMESGDIVWAEVNVAPLALPDARAVVIVQDITERKRTEQAQERALSLMLAALESTADGILVVNTEGKIVTFNRLFARMWHLPDEVLASKEDARALECALDQLVEPENFIEKVGYLYCHPEAESFDQLVFKDGRVFERYSRPQLIGGRVAGRVWSFRDITERNQGREALQKANRQLRSLSRRLFQVQEQEKRHLARELHDEIGQALTAVKINLTSLGTGNGDNSRRLVETIALLDNLLRQVRQISLDLHPSLLDDLGLAAALRSLLDQQARRAGLRAQFCAAQLTDNIDVAISSTAFRIAQEAITNVLRHAKASFIKVQLQTEAGRLRIEVADDGAGFDVAEARQRSHQEAGFGLMGMKERAALVGGEVRVTSARGTGTRVQISLPLKENGSTP